MDKKVLLMLCCLVLGSHGCGSSPPFVQNEDAQSQLRAIVHLETRSEITTVLSGRNGRVYTIKAKDGKIHEEQISEAELWTKFPAIYHLLKTSYAGDGRSSTLWAGGNL